MHITAHCMGGRQRNRQCCTCFPTRHRWFAQVAYVYGRRPTIVQSMSTHPCLCCVEATRLAKLRIHHLHAHHSTFQWRGVSGTGSPALPSHSTSLHAQVACHCPRNPLPTNLQFKPRLRIYHLNVHHSTLQWRASAEKAVLHFFSQPTLLSPQVTCHHHPSTVEKPATFKPGLRLRSLHAHHIGTERMQHRDVAAAAGGCLSALCAIGGDTVTAYARAVCGIHLARRARRCTLHAWTWFAAVATRRI